MLEKNKDYLEMRVSSIDCAFTQNAATQISIDGYVYTPYMNMPDPGELYILIEKEKVEQLQTENEQLKKKLAEFSPAPGYREFLTALYPEGDVEKLVWATEQLCCGRDLRHNLQVDLEYYRALSSSQAKSIYGWKEATGCSTPEEAETTMRNLRGRIDEIKEFAAIASNWTDRIVEA